MGKASELSRRRAQALQTWLREANVGAVDASRLHGTSRTNARRALPTEPSVVIGGSLQLNESDPIPQDEVREGPPLSPTEYAELATFIETAEPPNDLPGIIPPRMLGIDYRPVPQCSPTNTRGSVECNLSPFLLSYSAPTLQNPDASTLSKWAADMFDNGCDVSKVGVPSRAPPGT